MNNHELARIRKDYETEPLSSGDCEDSPFDQFETWFSQAVAAEVHEPNAMVVATASANGVPSARTVLLKDFDANGFVFYTNLGSQKARELVENPRASIVFLWLPLHRQVRIEGIARPVSPDQSDRYFASRPRGAQIGAVVSPQSSVIPSRQWLEDRIDQFEAAHPESVGRPSHWGGIRVEPSAFEFWQGRRSRLHDRIRYLPTDVGWARTRLAP